jgi:hypothetical protein
MLAEAGATTELVGRLLAEARRKRPNDRMILCDRMAGS